MGRLFRLALAVPLALSAAVLAVPPEAQNEKDTKKKADPSGALNAAKAARVEGGLTATAWAAEPLLANPVAFAFDEHGRCFVVETNRLQDGVPDTRGHMYWLDDDIGSRSVADRLQKYQKHKYPDYTKYAEQLRVVWDSTGGGHADKSDVFAGGFNHAADGIAAGVLARKGTVYFTCIPDVYAFGADKDRSTATSKKSFASGFGIRDQFVGHDLHGLVMGPDGKLYFSVGDRGLNVTSADGKKLFNPDSGAVLRCDPDGTNMEIVHVGLRNPQELAFDDFGNLFTYDNNSDSGDQARWVQVVEGGDSGWRCGYQYGTLMHTPAVPQGNRGPWNAEKIWHVPGPDGGPPAYVVPPLLHIGNGPSGLVHYPGVGLSDRYKGHFFACDFTSNPGNSKIWTLAVKPKGASFEVVDLHPFVQNMVPTDCDFGPDGAFYWLDWVGGWNKPGKGRVFRVADPEALKNPAVKEAQALLAEGLGKKSVEELAKLLAHPHQKVRLEAQYELAGRREALATFKQVAMSAANELACIHAVWGLGMVGRKDAKAFDVLMKLADPAPVHSLKDTELSAQILKALGGHKPAAGLLARHIIQSYDKPRLQYYAVQSYGKVASLKEKEKGAEFEPLFKALVRNGEDAYLRHAVAQAMARMTTNPCQIIDAVGVEPEKYRDKPTVRLGVVLALRKLQCRRLGEFLNDSDPTVVAEAARAIHDQDLMTPMADLAKLADKPGQPEAVAFRALNANFKLGGPDHAVRLAQFAARTSEPDYLRAVALKLLGMWAKPPRLDQITGLRQDLPERPGAVAADAVRPVVGKLFAGSDAVRKEAVQVVSKLGITEVGELMAGIVTDAGQSAGTRVEALFALEALKAKELAPAAKAALASGEPKLRAAGRVVAAKADFAAAVRDLPALLTDEKATPIEKQMALGVLGGLRESKEVDAALAEWMDRLIAGTVPAELQLDVLEAAQQRANTRRLRLHALLREKLKEYDQKVRAAAGDNTALRFPEARAGGDAEKGREIFLNSAAVYCQRCHKVDGQGGEVGPVLNGIGSQKDRAYLIESIVNPNAQIAQGYQSVILNTVDGKTLSGVLRSKDKKQYVVVTAENKVLTVPADDVEGEKPDKSAMPDDLYKKISKRELRDLIEFLASLKESAKK